jgi:hypothetical protein
MKTLPSPFHPTFGASPPELAGRHQVVEEIAAALDDGPGSAARAALIVGARGIGKTATLNAIEDAAGEAGWLVLSDTATPGLAERLVRERLPEAVRDVAEPRGRRVAGVTLPGNLGGLSFDLPPDAPAPGLRESLARAIDLVHEHGGGGVLISIDEVHGRTARADLVELAAQVQHLVRQRRDVALVAAGLPAAVQDLLSDDVLTFLRRAKRFSLQVLTAPDAEDALALPIRGAGREIESDALDAAVEASAGYPYLIQAIGDHAWRHAPKSRTITAEDVAWAVRRAVADLGQQVLEPALRDLSPVDREFLTAMSLDDGPSRIRDVATRMGRDSSYISRYRARLLAAEMVAAAGHGLVDFTLPYLREHLRAR